MRSRRLILLSSILLVAVAIDILRAQSPGTTLRGTSESSPTWGSGWLNLTPPIDFRKGERLRLTLGGSATRVVVRLLPKDSQPDTTDGVIPSVMSVPKTRVIEVVIPNDSPQVKQISVHGGSNPWGQFPLGNKNGSATIVKAELLKPIG
jgi:hypothetical protein